MNGKVDQSNEMGELFSLVVSETFEVTLSANHFVALGLAILLLAYILYRIIVVRPGIGWANRFDIDEAELGIGNSKIILRPNDVDRQIAYKIWVELSTRKIGLKIDLENDVIVEVYDSWYAFFSVTRDLIKDVPVSRFRRRDTEKIITLSIDVLNLGLRPHLTKWQARYRRWYEMTLSRDESKDLSPQEVQKKYPEFEPLQSDMMEVNYRLISYREKMHALVTNL